MNTSPEHELFAKWLNEDLSETEMKKLQGLEKYPLYKRIADESVGFEAPYFDQESVLGRIRAAVNTRPERKVVPLYRYLGYAAGFAFLVVLLVFNFQKKTFSTGFGERIAVVLPDHSEVMLNAQSHISFKKYNWEKNRKIKLSGEAFFEVAKGETFEVETKNGLVKVLGTEFNVSVGDDFLQVKCFEGKVSVQTENNDTIILEKGKAFRAIEGKGETWEIVTDGPSWTVDGESRFDRMPLNMVILALENEYGITIEPNNVDVEREFTGVFPHGDMETALKVVFDPMGIDHAVDDRTVFLKNR